MTRLRQVLTNLLGNAVKFTEKGYIELSLRAEPQEQQNYILHFQVKDTGIGIPEQKLKEIFSPFRQADASSTRKYGGTGLGLSISKQLVQIMGGQMWVESKEGHGSSFHFTLSATAATVQPAGIPEEQSLSCSGRHVLVLHSNPVIQELLREHLEAWNMTATVCSSLSEIASNLHSQPRFDAVVVDNETSDLKLSELEEVVGEIPVMVLYLLGKRHEGLAAQLQQKTSSRALFHPKPLKPSRVYNSLVDLFHKTPLQTKRKSKVLFSDPDLAKRRPFQILLVEDNAVNQKLASLMLSKFGYQSDVAANGVEALDAIARHQYDVVLMDMHMPKMDGVETSRRIQQLYPPQVRPWIIALTANAMQSDRAICFSAGMQDFLSKPIQPKNLQDALERVPRAWSTSSVLEEINAVDPPAGEELLRLYLEDTASTLVQLAQYAEKGDLKGVLRSVHTLKGSCRQIGATRMGDLAEHAESCLGSSGLENAALQIHYLRRSFQPVRREIQATLNPQGKLEPTKASAS